MGVSVAMIQKLEYLDPKAQDAFVYLIHCVFNPLRWKKKTSTCRLNGKISMN